MKILVTGGCGYKGSYLIPQLLEEGHQITSIDTQWFGNYLEDHETLTRSPGCIKYCFLLKLLNQPIYLP